MSINKNTGNNPFELLPMYDFNKLYHDDPLSASCLTNMHTAVKTITGAMEYIRDFKGDIQIDNIYIEAISML